MTTSTFVPDTTSSQPTWLWQPASAPKVRLAGLYLRPVDNTAEFAAAITTAITAPSPGTLDCKISLRHKNQTISGNARFEATAPTADRLLCHASFSFDQPVTADLTFECAFDILDPRLEGAWLPERSGQVLFQHACDYGTIAGRYELGYGAARTPGIEPTRGHDYWPKQMVRRAIMSRTGTILGMPVLGLRWNAAANLPALSVAADPYCGATLAASAFIEADNPCTRVSILTVTLGSLVPITAERRTFSLEFHAPDPDKVFRSFYHTIPEIAPAPEWIHDIRLNYYDYLSDNGQGWFNDLETLAAKIPQKYRSNVAVCLHGWYDYFQQYAYDDRTKKLLQSWTAFPGTRKIPMTVADMHRRLRFAKDKGFRTLLYFADGTNSDSGAPAFQPGFVLKDAQGQRSLGWKGPDSLDQPYKMDPSVPGLRDWYRNYLRALLDEYASDIDGLVWDETFYVPTEFVSYSGKQPAYADRAMLSLVSEFTQLVQSYRSRNPNLVFLASDCGRGSNALVANGTWEDAACTVGSWGPGMFSNYRNCYWSCNWVPVSEPQNNRLSAAMGMAQGVSNGWEDSQGPSTMPANILSEILNRFFQTCDQAKPRPRTLPQSEPRA